MNWSNIRKKHSFTIAQFGYTDIKRTSYKIYSETSIVRYGFTIRTTRYLYGTEVLLEKNGNPFMMFFFHDELPIATVACYKEKDSVLLAIRIAEEYGATEVEVSDVFEDTNTDPSWYGTEFGFEYVEDNPNLWRKALHGILVPRKRYWYDDTLTTELKYVMMYCKHDDYVRSYIASQNYENLRRVDGYIVGTLRRPVSVDIVILNEMLQPIAFVVCHKDSTLATLVCKEEDPVAHTCLRLAQEGGSTEVEYFLEHTTDNVYFLLHGETWFEKELGMQPQHERFPDEYNDMKQRWKTDFDLKDKPRDYFHYKVLVDIREKYRFFGYPRYWHKRLTHDTMPTELEIQS